MVAEILGSLLMATGLVLISGPARSSYSPVKQVITYEAPRTDYAWIPETGAMSCQHVSAGFYFLSHSVFEAFLALL